MFNSDYLLAREIVNNKEQQKKKERKDPDFIKYSLRKETTDNLKKYCISLNNQKETESRSKEIKEYVKQRVKRKFDRNKNDRRSLHVIKTE